MPTGAQVRVVKDVAEAVSSGDRSIVSAITDDFEARTSAFITGKTEFHGREGVLEWFDRVAALDARGSTLTLRLVRLLGDHEHPDVVCAIVEITVGRPRGGDLNQESAYVLRFDGERVARLDGYADPADGLARLAEPYELD